MTQKSRSLTSLLLITAICLSGAAAYYSIAGLVAIFAAAAIPVIVMGSTLEVAKLVISSWIYRNWNDTPRALRFYFCSAIAILMLLTSMGIFGFLSKAHVDQNLVSGDVVARLSLIDEQIKTERENIDANRKIINQLDQAVDQTIARSTDESGAARSAALRRSQAKDRSQTQAQILSAQEKINRLQSERSPIAAQVREVEAEVGPIKYIAQLIYGQEATDSSVLEKAVRIVILMIVFVFDPLAVLMFIAVNQDIARMYHKVSIESRNDSPVIHSKSDETDRIWAKDMSKEDWTEFFAQTPVDPDPEIIQIEVPDVSPVVEGSTRANGNLYHIAVTDHVTVESVGDLKHDQGMHGLFSQRIG